MAMIAGSSVITIDATTGTPSATGTGLAKAMADALCAGGLKTTYEGIVAAGQKPSPSDAPFWSSLLNDLAAGIVPYIQATAKAHVTTEVLGRTPNPNNPNTNIQPPTAAVDIPIL